MKNVFRTVPSLRGRTVILLAAIASLAGMARGQQCTVEVNQFSPMPLDGVFATISEALAAVASTGDVTICVHPGTYEEAVSITAVGRAVTVRSLRGPEVTKLVAPEGNTRNGVTLAGSGSPRIIGFTIQGFIDGIFVENGVNAGTTVANCIVRGNADDGIEIILGVDLAISVVNNTFAYNGSSGARFVASNSQTLSRFVNNIVFHNDGTELNNGFRGTFGNYNCVFDTRDTFLIRDTNGSFGADSITLDPNIDQANNFRFVDSSSPCVGAGNPEILDPNGSISDIGAFGGPFAAPFFRDPFGAPTIETVTVDPPQVRPGTEQTVTVRGTARTD